MTDEPFKWEARRYPNGLNRYMTQAKYDMQTPAVQAHYKPICEECFSSDEVLRALEPILRGNPFGFTGRFDEIAKQMTDALLSALADQRRLREAATGNFHIDWFSPAFCSATIRSESPSPDNQRSWGHMIEGQRVAVVPIDPEGGHG